MTVIEFFDRKNAIENVLSTLLCQPDKVLFVGKSKKQMDAKLKYYRQVLQKRYLEVELDSIGLNQNDLAHIVEVLSGIVESNDLCVFNLDGGEDLYLVAVGMVAQRYAEKVQLHRFNVRNNTITDCDADGNDQLVAPIRVSVEENALIYGGRVIYEDERPGTTPRWVLNEEFCQDIRAMWEICKLHPGRWNWTFSQLDRLGRNGENEKEDLQVCIAHFLRLLEDPVKGYSEVMAVLQPLQKQGVIRNLVVNQEALSFSYKNQQIKKALLKAGTLLELYITVTARGLFDDDDERIYHDVQNGVWLDWDGKLEESACKDVNNEIDVLLMRGAVPVFISCKNGDVKREELFLLEAVANRFGGEYARKVLVVTDSEKLDNKEDPLHLRATAMGIRLITDIDQMSRKELEHALRNC